MKWKSNMEDVPIVDNDLEAVVTYYRKGDTKRVGAVRLWTQCHERSVCFCYLTSYYLSQVSKTIKPATEDQQKMKFFEIVGRDLEPSTTYVVSVKSYLSRSKLFSDPSQEMEFTTRKSYLYHDGSASHLSDIVHFPFQEHFRHPSVNVCRYLSPPFVLLHALS